MAAQRLLMHPPRRTCIPRSLAPASVLLGSARQAGSERLSGSRDASRLNASSSRLLAAVVERLLASCGKASLDAIIDWEAPSVSKRSLQRTVSQPPVAAQVRARLRPGG